MKYFGITFCVLLLSTGSPAQVGTWVDVPTPTANWLHDVQFVDADYGYAVGDLGTVLRSSDGGLHWDSLPPPVTNILKAVHFTSRDTGWAGGNGTGIIIHTTDGGQSWTTQDSGNVVTDLEFVSATTGWATTFSGVVFKTTNGGSDWVPQTVPDPSVYFTAVKFLNPDTGWITGKYPGTVLRTVDGGGTWTESTVGLSVDDDYNDIDFIDATTGWLTGFYYGTSGVGLVKKSTDGGQTWSPEFEFPNIEFLSVDFASPDEGYVSGIEGMLFRTTNGGTGWSAQATGVNRELSKVFVRGGEGGWIVGPEGMILRNDFGGLAAEYQVAMNGGWNMISMPYVTPLPLKDTLFPTAVSSLFYFDQGYFGTDTVENGVGYWLKFPSSQSVTVLGRPVDSLNVPLRAGWNLIGGIASAVPVESVSVASPTAVLSSFFRFDPAGYQSVTILDPGIGFWVKSSEATEILLMSGSAGKNRPAWTMLNPALLSSAELPPSPPESPAEAGTEGDPVVPSEYFLGQNYPNPFNPVTHFTFNLPEESGVTLEVFDALGRTVAVILRDGGMQAGSHDIQWSPGISTGLSSGMYYYRITARSLSTGKQFSEIKNMIYLK